MILAMKMAQDLGRECRSVFVPDALACQRGSKDALGMYHSILRPALALSRNDYPPKGPRFPAVTLRPWGQAYPLARAAGTRNALHIAAGNYELPGQHLDALRGQTLPAPRDLTMKRIARS